MKSKILSSFQTENEMDERHTDPDDHYYSLPGLNDIGRWRTPIFLLMDHFLCWFSTFSEKIKKIHPLEV